MRQLSEILRHNATCLQVSYWQKIQSDTRYKMNPTLKQIIGVSKTPKKGHANSRHSSLTTNTCRVNSPQATLTALIHAHNTIAVGKAVVSVHVQLGLHQCPWPSRTPQIVQLSMACWHGASCAWHGLLQCTTTAHNSHLSQPHGSCCSNALTTASCFPAPPRDCWPHLFLLKVCVALEPALGADGPLDHISTDLDVPLFCKNISA